jgi:predicted HicB family RNase H-like nuclease
MKYESKKKYSKYYNSTHKSIRINSKLHDSLIEYSKDKNISIKKIVENLLYDFLSNEDLK